VLQAIGVLAIASISRASARIGACHIPGLRTEHTQKSTGTHCRGAFFEVKGLHYDTALFTPEVVEGVNYLLKCKRHLLSSYILLEKFSIAIVKGEQTEVFPLKVRQQKITAKRLESHTKFST
jgi:hypothetical protein